MPETATKDPNLTRYEEMCAKLCELNKSPRITTLDSEAEAIKPKEGTKTRPLRATSSDGVQPPQPLVRPVKCAAAETAG